MTDFFPPQPAGSNAIGSFQIGVSPIGTITPFNWQDTVISQYANSPRILTLIENFNGCIDQSANMDAFFDMMWNIDTAAGYGLDVWGRILGISRTLAVSAGDYFGFDEALPGANPYNTQPFYSGEPVTENYDLSDTAYRQLLLAKAAANICDGSISAINALLMALFPGRGNAYVQDGSVVNADFFGFQEAGQPNAQPYGQAPFYSGQSLGRMTMTYVFDFDLTPVEQSIVLSSGVLPQPTGVLVLYQIN